LLIINLILIKIFYMNQSESQIKGSNIKELSQLKEDIQIKKKNQYDKIMKINVSHQDY